MLEQTHHKAGFVNIIGKPNAGKSTLLNNLVKERLAIISPKAQTTRHRIVGIVSEESYQIIFSDTPGIIEQPKYKLHEGMMHFVDDALVDSDVLLYVVDVHNKPEEEPAYFDKVKDRNDFVLVINKIDLCTDFDSIKQMWQQVVGDKPIFGVSSKINTGVAFLWNYILKEIPEHPPYYEKDALTDRPERFFVSEIVREKIFLLYKQEIPYCCDVAIESFKELPNITRITAIIFVARESQKPILIGKNGSMLKKVGIAARLDIEKFLQKSVYLELFVKVKDNWRDNEAALKQLGYT